MSAIVTRTFGAPAELVGFAWERLPRLPRGRVDAVRPHAERSCRAAGAEESVAQPQVSPLWGWTTWKRTRSWGFQRGRQPFGVRSGTTGLARLSLGRGEGGRRSNDQGGAGLKPAVDE